MTLGRANRRGRLTFSGPANIGRGTRSDCPTLTPVKAAWESLTTTGRVFLVLALLGVVGMVWRASQAEWDQALGQAVVMVLFASLPARQWLRR